MLIPDCTLGGQLGAGCGRGGAWAAGARAENTLIELNSVACLQSPVAKLGDDISLVWILSKLVIGHNGVWL